MRKLRRLPVEEAVQQQLLGHRADPLLGPQHVGDAHLVVVDHHRQVVRRVAVLLEDDLVVRHRRVGRTADHVVERERHVVGHAHANDRRRVEAR